MPVPPNLPHASTISSVASSTSSAPHPSIVHRLVESVPEHAVHLFEKLFASNTLQYTPPHNDPHDSAPASPTSLVQDDDTYMKRAREWGRRRSSAASKEKEKEREVGGLDVVEVNGCQIMDPETARPSEEYGVPLCREAEIEKWNEEPHEEAVRKRRKSILH